MQGGGDDGFGPSPLHDPHSSQGPSTSKGLITQSMMRKIQEGLEQQEPTKLHELHMFFSWAKMNIKYDGFLVKTLV